MQSLLATALDSRRALIDSLHTDATTCYRLFHGTNEGVPGLTVDRYGDQLLVQTFHESVTDGDVAVIAEAVQEALGLDLDVIYNDRSAANSRRKDESTLSAEETHCTELGVNYLVRGKHAGQDPLLFLDMRAGRRWVKQNAEGKSLLNLFAYTCGVGVVAAKSGATRVLNVDFAERSLAVGRENAALNNLSDNIEFCKSDFFPAIKQLAGIPIKPRGRKGKVKKMPDYPQLAPEQFDVVYLDPPRWAKSIFGTVDLIRDYQSVFKPSLLATKPGGQLVAVNNVAQVDRDEWVTLMQRCAEKAERPIRQIDIIEPEADFPSRDGNPPLKMAVLSV